MHRWLYGGAGAMPRRVGGEWLARGGRGVVMAGAVLALGSGWLAPVAAAGVAPAGPSQSSAPQRVIVILKAQFPVARAGSGAAVARSAAVASAQAPLLSVLRGVHASGIRTYSLVDSLAARVPGGEIARLKADPAVSEVVPDVTIQGPRPGPVRRAGR